MRTAKLDDTGALSDTGFSDLPSDHEEMFYFDDMEREEIAREYVRFLTVLIPSMQLESGSTKDSFVTLSYLPFSGSIGLAQT